MDAMVQLTGFYRAIADDQRIGVSHISLYMAFFIAWMIAGCKNPVPLDRVAVMRVAKIRARETYQRCLWDLHKYGYVRYEPSFNSQVPSLVSMVYWPEEKLSAKNIKDKCDGGE